jgi:LysR family transcriptional regulator of beta-lactamase
MDRLPTLNGLRAFESAARLGGFTAAAQELHVTQAAVSRSVKALEGQLGYAVFLRNANALALTPEGRMLVPELTAAFELMAKATQRVRQSRAAPVLTVGVGPTFAIRWLIPRLGRFQQRHPEIEVHTATGGATALLRPEWTCSLRLGKDPSAGVVSEPLFSPEMGAVAHSGRRRAGAHRQALGVPLPRLRAASRPRRHGRGDGSAPVCGR